MITKKILTKKMKIDTLKKIANTQEPIAYNRERTAYDFPGYEGIFKLETGEYLVCDDGYTQGPNGHGQYREHYYAIPEDASEELIARIICTINRETTDDCNHYDDLSLADLLCVSGAMKIYPV